MRSEPDDARARFRHSAGFTLVEIMSAVLITSLLVVALGEVVGSTLGVRDHAAARNERVEAARFVLERMIRAVEASDHLFLPRPDNPGTAQDESDRDPGVLALTLGFTVDRNRNGTPDADNDGDGRFNEDPTGDVTGDMLPGVALVDDDNDGQVDEVHAGGGPAEDDDDEDGTANEDGWDGTDNDGDGWIDEDGKKDTSGEGIAGFPGFDDDGDTQIDEGDKNDDDEDGSVNEDWFDTVVFRLSGTDLIERFPVPWDTNSDSTVTGEDYYERVIVDGVTQFRVVRIVDGAGLMPLVEITIALDAPMGDPVVLSTRVRIGAGA